jgi:capping protein alpha
LEKYNGDMADAAQELVKQIRAKEDEVQVAVNEAYGQLAETTFKKLRRQLPITRAKVDW